MADALRWVQGGEVMFCTETETLKARRPHLCTSCGQHIGIGESYKRWRTFDQGDAGTSKMHPECFEMHQADAADSGNWEYTPFSHERPTKEAAA